MSKFFWKMCLAPLAYLLAMGIFCPPSPAVTAAEAKIKEIVRAADILAPDYRRQVNVAFGRGVVSISVFRNPEATAKDCKIDAVLLARKVMDSGAGEVRRVRILFYEFGEEDRYWLAVVDCADVAAFAGGRLGQEALLHNVALSEHQGNPLSDIYGRLSYKSIIQELSVVDGPQREQRAAMLVSIRHLSSHGLDVADLNRAYLHAEDLARRGQEAALKAQMACLQKLVDGSLPAAGRSAEERLKALSPGNPVELMKEAKEKGGSEGPPSGI